MAANLKPENQEKRRYVDKSGAPRRSYAFHAKSEQFKRLLMVLELCVSALVFLAILHTRLITEIWGDISYDDHIVLLIGIVIVIGIMWPFCNRKYDLQLRSVSVSFVAVGKTMLASFAIIAVVLFLLKMEFVSRSVLVGFFAFNTVILVGIRSFLAWWYLSHSSTSQDSHMKLLIIGSGPRAHRLANQLRTASDWGLDVIGFLDPHPNAYNRRGSDNVLGHINEISSVLQSNVVDEVIIAIPRKLLNDLQLIIDACQEEGVKLRFMADIYDFEAARVRLTLVDKIPLLSFEPVARNEVLLLVKRFFDIIAVLLLLPILLPVLALVSIIVRLDSPGPAIYMQERVGLQKRRFQMYKFRSMVVDADERLEEVEHLNEASGPNFKIENDPRLTRIGAILRKSSIDEIPQLINVLRGEMSLVGPRPMSVRDVKLFDRGIQRKRFSVRPGITCLWQVSGRSNLSFDDWLALDLKYIDEWSIGLDFKILLKTIPTVLKGTGAA